MSQSFSPFAYGTMSLVNAVAYWQKRQVQDNWQDSPFLHKPIIAGCVKNSDRQMAVWILFRHVSVEKYAADGVWESGTFEYQVWGLENPELMPVLMRLEVVPKQHPDGLAHTPTLADDWDESWFNVSFLPPDVITMAWTMNTAA